MGAILNLTKEQKRFYGVYHETGVFSNNKYLNWFMSGAPIPPTTKTTLQFDVKLNKKRYAQLKKRSEPGIVLTKNKFARVTIKPGIISDSTPIDADDYQDMTAGEVEVLMGGEMVKTPSAMLSMGTATVKDGVESRKELMCSQAIATGLITSSDGTVTWDYNLPAVLNVTWDSNTGITKIISDGIREFRKRNGKMPNEIEIGAEIADNMLNDDKYLRQAEVFGYNIATAQAEEKALIIGTVLGQLLKEMDMVFDENGVSVVADDQIRFLDTSAFRPGWAGIAIKDPVTKAPAMLAADVFVSMDEGTESEPTANLFAKSAFFPVIVNTNAILRYKVTIA